VIIDLAVVGRDPLFGGGGWTQTEAFCSAARELGHEPELLFDPHPGLRGPRLTWRRVEVLRQLAWARRPLPSARAFWVVSTHATDGGRVARQKREYDAWIGTTVGTELAGRATGLPRMRRAAAAVGSPLLRAIERDVLRGARRLYATSAASRNDVAEASGRGDVGILPIPIDSERFAPAARWPPSKPMIVFVGRSDDPRKNVGLLIEAARRLPDVRVVLAGTPPNGWLPPNVEAVGAVANVASVLSDATLFVLPSRQEGFGIAAAEALAAGVPVVTTPSGGPEELVRASSGGVVLSDFSPDELATTVRDLLADMGTLSAMRAAGRAYVEREHSPERFRTLLAQALA
jgi:glycosyltransferase involved in cell wall biosynthesis